MALRRWWQQAETVAGAPGVSRLPVDAGQWLQVATDAAAGGAQLLSLWVTPASDASTATLVRAALHSGDRLLIAELALADPESGYRGLEQLFPAAARMQRAAFDLCGVRADAPDQRPWLRHQAWPALQHPLRSAPASLAPDDVPVDDYEFVRVAGDGVHEVPVGPVHAGIIEPGHFRFSVVGEKVLRLEERLGYAHKGIERRFTEVPLLEGHRLAARVSGDSAVAYSWAYCQAAEGLGETVVPERAAWLRALCLELERIQNHLGDLGALGNDAGFAFGLAQFSRLKEQLLRGMQQCCGQRYLFDAIVPGGVAFDTDARAAAALAAQLAAIASASHERQEIYDEHAGLRDRFVGAGQVSPELALRLGLTGMAGRASGQDRDLRTDQACTPYDQLAPRKYLRTEGDVAARVALRFDELQESCRLAQRILASLPAGATRVTPQLPAPDSFAVGLVEGWRGPVMIALESAAPGTIRRCHPHDPSWQNWPVLEHAIIGNIVPDFPLINKSFNLSYSGHDL